MKLLLMCVANEDIKLYIIVNIGTTILVICVLLFRGRFILIGFIREQFKCGSI